MKNGKETSWYENGQIKSNALYANDAPEGRQHPITKTGQNNRNRFLRRARKKAPKQPGLQTEIKSTSLPIRRIPEMALSRML